MRALLEGITREQRRDVPPGELLGRLGEHTLHRPRDEAHRPVEVGDRDQVGRVLHHDLVEAPGTRKLLLGLLERGDVLDLSEEELERAVGVARRRDADARPERRAVPLRYRCSKARVSTPGFAISSNVPSVTSTSSGWVSSGISLPTSSAGS
jgi:hypothetical protein